MKWSRPKSLSPLLPLRDVHWVPALSAFMKDRFAAIFDGEWITIHPTKNSRFTYVGVGHILEPVSSIFNFTPDH